MKTRNLILAGTAFCFAIGAAIASSLDPTNIWVHAKTSATSETICVNTGVSCDAPGTNTCTVTVNVAKPGTGGTQQASSNSTISSFKTYFPTDCTVVLNAASNTSVSSAITGIYELRP